MANYTSKGYTTPAGVNSREAVRQWQQMLGVTADGIWGKNTEAAFQQWQRDIRNSSAGANPTAPVSIGGSKQSGASYSAGAAQQQTTTQQKSTGSVLGGWRERMGHTDSNVTGGKTAADPLPSLNWNSAGLGVSGIGAQLAAARGAAQQNTTPKKTYPLSEYEYPMHGTGAGGIGGQMNADKIAAAAEEKKQRQQQYITNPNPFTAKSSNYGTLGGWQTSMPVSEKPEPVEYTGGLGGVRYHIDQAQDVQPDTEVLLDQSQLTEEKKVELTQEEKKPQFKLAETAHNTTGTDNYRKKEYEALVFWTQLPAEARQPGQGADYFQPAVAYLEAENAKLEQELQYWTNLKTRGNPVLTKDADSMIASLRRDIEKNEKTLSKLIYILPEDIFRNEFGAKYADLLCLRTLDKEQKKLVSAAVEDLKATRLACYIEGDYGRSAAAEDILNALERKLPGVAALTGGANDYTLGLPDLLVSWEYGKQNTDYDRFLTYMASADAVQAANPNAYAAGEFVSTAAQGVKSVIDLGKEAIEHLGGKALSEAGKEFWEAMGKRVFKDAVESEVIDAFEAKLGKRIQQNYNHPK